MMSGQPHYDHLFGRLIRLLAELGLEMHSPRKGPPYLVRKMDRRVL